MIPNFGSLTDSQMYTLQLHQQGLSVEEIARHRNFCQTVVVEHLIKLILMNQAVDINRLVSLPRQQAIIRAMETVGDGDIQTIYEYLGGEYRRDEIRFVRAAWRQYRMEF